MKVKYSKKSDIKKGTKVKVNGKEGIIASEDMNNGQYIVQIGDKMKGAKPERVEIIE